MSLFEKELEEISIASDVINVEAEDPATLSSLERTGPGRGGTSAMLNCGCMLFGSLVRKPQDRNNSPISISKTKQHRGKLYILVFVLPS